MSDNKTVTFDALIEYLKHTRGNHESSIAARDPIIAAHIKDLSEWIDALAAPTPAAQSADRFRQMADMVDHSGDATEKVAAQSAGQEAIYQYQVPTISGWHDCDAEAFARISELEYVETRIVYAAPVNGGEREQALRWATELAVSLYRQHYASEAPGWKPLPDLVGVISQIDNMTTGLTRAADAQQVDGERVNRETVIEWLDALDLEVTDKQLDGLFHARTAIEKTKGGHHD